MLPKETPAELLERLYQDGANAWQDHWTEEQFLERISQQVDQERRQIGVGVKTLRDLTASAENRAYASSTVYGVSCIQELLPKAEEAIEKK